MWSKFHGELARLRTIPKDSTTIDDGPPLAHCWLIWSQSFNSPVIQPTSQSLWSTAYMVVEPSEKWWSEWVSDDFSFPIWWESHVIKFRGSKMFQSTNQECQNMFSVRSQRFFGHELVVFNHQKTTPPSSGLDCGVPSLASLLGAQDRRAVPPKVDLKADGNFWEVVFFSHIWTIIDNNNSHIWQYKLKFHIWTIINIWLDLVLKTIPWFFFKSHPRSCYFPKLSPRKSAVRPFFFLGPDDSDQLDFVEQRGSRWNHFHLRIFISWSWTNPCRMNLTWELQCLQCMLQCMLQDFVPIPFPVIFLIVLWICTWECSEYVLILLINHFHGTSWNKVYVGTVSVNVLVDVILPPSLTTFIPAHSPSMAICPSPKLKLGGCTNLPCQSMGHPCCMIYTTNGHVNQKLGFALYLHPKTSENQWKSLEQYESILCSWWFTQPAQLVQKRPSLLPSCDALPPTLWAGGFCWIFPQIQENLHFLRGFPIVSHDFQLIFRCFYGVNDLHVWCVLQEIPASHIAGPKLSSRSTVIST